MIVDLLRNDMNRISKIGSEEVTASLPSWTILIVLTLKRNSWQIEAYDAFQALSMRIDYSPQNTNYGDY